MPSIIQGIPRPFCRVVEVARSPSFNPSHQWVHNKIQAGELSIQQMDVQTCFFRRMQQRVEGPAGYTKAAIEGPACLAGHCTSGDLP